MLHGGGGRGVQTESKSCKLQILRDVQRGNTCVRKKLCGMSINMHGGAE